MMDDISEEEKFFVGFIDEYILIIVQELIGVGFDIIVSILQWIVLFMLMNLEYQEKVYVEV